MTCEICKRPIKKGDQIAVFSIPLKSLDNNGNYDMFSDFFVKEKKVHAECFKIENLKNPSPDESNRTVSDDTVKKLCTVLSEVGEDVDTDEVYDFVAEHLEIADLSELVGEWFRNRNGVV